MSGGRQFVEWQVFGPTNIMTWAEKLRLDKKESDTGDKQVVFDGFKKAAATGATAQYLYQLRKHNT